VIYYSTSGKHDEPGFDRVDLDTLMRESDVISVHAPLNDATKGLVGKRELGLMNKTAIILNLGRGGIIDEADLADVLEAGTIAGAGTDVLTKEPIAADNPLMRIKDSGKLVITPHIAWASVEARRRCAEEVYLNIEAWMNGNERNICK
ncbi:MAG: hydroxyacid dehydrogenase, partial [Clostridiales bacterium]|nr:hydroxyacid dehydrogenase [Clostridiales bacterium]